MGFALSLSHSPANFLRHSWGNICTVLQQTQCPQRPRQGKHTVPLVEVNGELALLKIYKGDSIDQEGLNDSKLV